MRIVKKIFTVSMFISIIALIGGCSSSTLVDVWKDPTFHEAPLKKIFVIGLRKDNVQRRIWEDAFALELTKQGVTATSSYHLFPESLPDTFQVIQVIADKGYDGVLITRVLYAETKTEYVKGYDTQEQVFRYNKFRNRYDSYYRTVQHPGYEETKTIDRRAIDVWVIRDEERLIWSATSNTPERTTVEAVQTDIVELVIPELSKNAIIQIRK
ncbi:MAG: hypothetical protein HY965_08365 [Ignavibacteriales bacterium]|nr:hypothetical protein [Ignavibacteriales bacterium]